MRRSTSVCKEDFAILICFGGEGGLFLVIEEPDAKAVLRLMMTDTAPQIEAVSEATITTDTDFHLCSTR